MTDYFYEISKFQEHGFCSSTVTIAWYKNREKAIKKCKELNDSSGGPNSLPIYSVIEREFSD